MPSQMPHEHGGADAPPRCRNPFAFVVGCPRSGTTLLQRMLDSHPSLTVANDTHFIPRAIRWDAASGEVHDPPLTPGIVERLRGNHRFERLGLRDGDLDRAAGDAATYAGLVERLYDARAAARRKPLAGEKTPDYVRCIPLLAGLFPWARVVHLVRDGRDVALSTLEWADGGKGPGRFELWRDEPVAVCALWWTWQVGSGRRDGAALPASFYREVRYEDLVRGPAVQLGQLTAWLGLPFSEEMLRFHEGRTRAKPGRSAKSAWLPPTVGLREWRDEMHADDVELFEALAGDLLTQLGYERRFGSISIAIAARAERCRDWWEAELDRRAAQRRTPIAPVP